MNTATFIKDVSGKFKGRARLYRVDPPMPYGWDWDKEACIHSAQYVVSSAACPYGGIETYIFPTDKEGNVINWSELEGSTKGIYDCDQAIRNAGYEVR